MRSTEAQARCDSDVKCLGLHWLNNAGSNRVGKQYIRFDTDDGRFVSEGFYQGCGGQIATVVNKDWDVIVKPGK